MTPKKTASKRLVIDASVARAAGLEGSTSPPSIRCREFLQLTLKICHRAVMPPKLRDEWRRHQSRFSRKWYKAMLARKKIIHLEPDPDPSIRDRVRGYNCTEKKRRVLVKDLHLVEAALQTDHIVVSLDDEARGCFAEAARHLAPLRVIAWVDPGAEDARAWLHEGAKKDQANLLS
jgi:hypothetical protein